MYLLLHSKIVLIVLVAELLTGSYVRHTKNVPTERSNVLMKQPTIAATGTVRGQQAPPTCLQLPPAASGPGLALRGLLTGTSVELLWDVEHEADGITYGVERSYNGSSFRRIGEIWGFEGYRRHTYRFRDPGPQPEGAIVYYRIAVAEEGGRRFFSATKALLVPACPEQEPLAGAPPLAGCLFP